jgi:sensor histidine kinase regulating citrate/malate metabolism
MPMDADNRKNEIANWVYLAMDFVDAAVTIIDTKGIILYYNAYAAKILDRKPEYIGMDAHSHHKKPASNKKFDSMLQEFAAGRTAPFHYLAKPYGAPIMVTLTPIIKDRRFVGCVQTSRLKED